MGATRRSAQGGCEGFGQACSGGNAEAWLQDLCQRDRASNDHMARPLLPLRHCGQDGPRLREEDTPTPQAELGEEACDAECRQGQEVVGGLGPEVGRCVSTAWTRT